MRTIRRDAIHEAQPAQRRLRAWRDCRAPVPSVFPSAASPDGKTEGTGVGGEHPASSGTPRALETIGIHLNIALGLSNEVGPPHTSTFVTNAQRCPRNRRNSTEAGPST